MSVSRNSLRISAVSALLSLLMSGSVGTPDSGAALSPPAQVAIRALASQVDRIQISFDLPDPVIGEAPSSVSIPGSVALNWSGLPDVPVIRRFIAVPECDRVDLMVDTADRKTFHGVTIAPSSGMPGHGSAAGDKKLAFDRDRDFPGIWARVVSIQHVRGQALAELEVYPVQYNARRNVLATARQIRVQLEPVNPRGPVVVNVGPFQDALRATVPNFFPNQSAAKPTSKGVVATAVGQVCWCSTGSDDWQAAASFIRTNCSPDYLIIVADQLSHGDDSTLVDSLATKRAEFNGFNVAIARMSQIDSTPDTLTSAAGTAAKMFSFVHDIYTNGNAAHMADGHLGYLLLVGDAYDSAGTLILPTHYQNNQGPNSTVEFSNASDSYFATMSGFLPDILVGRLPVDADDDHWELANVVSKIVSFEPIPESASWKDRILLVSGGNDEEFTFDGEGLTGFQNFFNAIESLVPQSGKSFVQMHRLDAGSDSLFSKAVCDNIANGFCVVGLFDHANPVTFAGNSFVPLHYDTLQNAGALPLVLSIGSYSGYFDRLGALGCCTDTSYATIPCKVPPTPIDACDVLAERLVVQPNGAIGTIAFGRSFDPTIAQRVFANAFRALLQDKLGELGSLVVATRLMTDGGATTQALNLLGDPALNIDYSFDSVAQDSVDLAVSGLDMSFSPDTHDLTSPTLPETLTVTVSNRWKDTAYSVPVEVWDGAPDGGGTMVTGFTLSSVSAHGSTVWRGGIGTFSVGDHDIYVTVDPDDELADPVRVNNVSYRTLYVRDEPTGFPRNVGTGLGANSKPIVIAEAILGTPPEQEILARNGVYGADGTYLTPALLPVGNLLRSCARNCLGFVDQVDSILVLIYQIEVDGGPVVQRFSAPRGTVENVVALDEGSPDAMSIAILERRSSSLSKDLYLYDASGTIRWGRRIGDLSHGTYVMDVTMAAGDVSGDGVSDIVCAFSAPGGRDSLVVIDGKTGGREWVARTGDLDLDHAYLRLVDMENDGDLEILTNSASAPKDVSVQLYDRTGSLVWQVSPDTLSGWLFLAPADLAHDGTKEVVFATGSHIGVITASGSSASVSAEVNLGAEHRFVATPLAVDIDGDDQLEIVAFCRVRDHYLNEYRLELQLYESNLTPITPAYMFLADAGFSDSPFLYGEAAVGDIDGDGRIEVVFAQPANVLHALRIGTSAGRVDWGSAEGDAMRTGLYERTLAGTYDEPVGIVNRARVVGNARFDGGLTITAPSDVQVGSLDSLFVEDSLNLFGCAADSVRVRIDDMAAPGSMWGGFLYGAAGSHGHVHHAVLTDVQTALDHQSPLDVHDSRISRVGEVAVAAADSLSVVGTTITGSGGDGIYVSDSCTSPVVLSSCLIDACDIMGVNSYSEAALTLTGITITNCDIGLRARYGPVTVTSSTIDRCASYGGYLGKYVPTFDISASSFTENDVGLNISTVGTINGSTFEKNDDGIWITSSETTEITVDGCTVDSSLTSGVYVLGSYSQGTGQVLLAHNTIAGNVIGIYDHGGSSQIRSRNVVESNSRGIKCDLNSYAAVESSSVTENVYGIYITSGNPDLGHVSGGSSTGYNILNPNTTWYVNNTSGNTISAQQNYWPQEAACAPNPSFINGSVDTTYALCEAPNLSFSVYSLSDRDEKPPLPKRFSLKQNYPNPFNPTTTVAFDVPHVSQVQIAIYDVTGAVVSVLVDESRPPGSYYATWDGHNRRGQPVASGVYFLRMRADNFVETKKLLLLK